MLSHSLPHQLELYNTLKARIQSEYDLADEDAALLDTLEGATNLIELLECATREALYLEAQCLGVAELVSKMEERRSRMLQRAERLRRKVLETMLLADLKKIAAPDFTLTVVLGGKAVEITAPELLPEQFMRTRVDQQPNKRAILDALKSGEIIPGASLTDLQPHLQVRR